MDRGNCVGGSRQYSDRLLFRLASASEYIRAMNAGYSGTPLMKKLGVKAGSLIRVIDAPPAFLDWVRLQPEQPRWAETDDLADVTILFVEWQDRLTVQLPQAIDGLAVAGGLWIAWPKKASKVPTDITEDVLRTVILPTGLVDNKVCAIDEIWSGLRFVWRKEWR